MFAPNFGNLCHETASGVPLLAAQQATSAGRGSGKKERSLLFKSYISLEECQASASVPILLFKTPEVNNPATPAGPY